jgi:hypothetical protein
MNDPQQRPAAGCTSFQADIRPKFTEEDVEHMNAIVGMDLSDYTTVSDNADLILERLESTTNPMPPTPWPPEWIECFRQWITNGKQP